MVGQRVCLLLLFVPFVILQTKEAGDKFVLRKECQRPVHFGIQPCNNESSIRFHMDPSTLTCLAFNYTGCGGNENNFARKSDCYRRCIPMDFNRCPANSDAILRADGTAHCSELNRCTSPKAYCAMGFVVGLCCDKTVREKVNANYSPDCGPQKQRVSVDTGSFQETLLGKTCDANFCPAGSTCHQGDFFAYCCR